MVTNCLGERSFSRFKRIKLIYRITIFQGRLSALSIRCIKNDQLTQTNFNEFLDDFVMKKDQDKTFLIVYYTLFSLT